MEIVYKNHSSKFNDLLKSSNKCVILVSPFIKKEMAKTIAKTLNQNVKLKVLTTFDSDAMINGLFDPEALTILKENFLDIEINIANMLHAKIYIFDNQRAMVTSANLTTRGFESNIEYGVIIKNKERLQTILDDVESLFLEAGTLEEKIKDKALFIKKEIRSKRDEEDIKNTVELFKKARFNPVQIDDIPKQFFDIETVEPIYLSTPYEYRKNKKGNFRIKNVEFRINEIINFLEDNDIGLIGNYRIIGAKSYQFDKKVGTYLIVKEKVNDERIEKTNDKLYSGDNIQHCIQRGEWATPQAEFVGIKKLEEGLVSEFQFRGGTKMIYPIYKGLGPDTIFYIQALENDNEFELFEKQMWYYYNSHF